MRILHLPKWYPHRYDDQDGDFVARHVAAVAAHGGPGGGPVASAVVFAAVARGPLPGLIAEEADLGGPVPTWRYYYRARPTGWGPLDKLLKLGLWLACQRRGWRAVRRHWGGAGPDLVHAHVLLRTGLLACWLRLTRGIPYLLTEHWTLYLPARAAGIGWWRRQLTRLVVRRAGALHTVSGALAEALAALGARPARAAVIANVVDTDLFRPAAPGAPAPAGGTLLHVAAFHDAVKNLSGVLRVVAALRPAWPGLRLRIAGYGPDEARLRRYAAGLGLLADGTVAFLGKLPHAAVAAEMQRAAALVSFSRAETFGVVLLEMRACGRPVVATRTGGVPELFQPENAFGLLVAPDDEAALEAALVAVLAGTARFDPAQLRADADQRCAPVAVGEAFGALYRQVLGPAWRTAPGPGVAASVAKNG
ncbi:glycosyltransferase [Hymenobacter caeli]|uniref:Glycosyltransferase involved in cell wall biosynthesis n=1 Tax=Hymenobacter caeli TaxID=2735894 RepID=A0ABX2FLI7_9BACT|nr:glycosyltransferase [Hymenobacter caeli]NRT17995.1 glycosyltransferase involved in cell wall biosynthesis [Hymenobacter caeli]